MKEGDLTIAQREMVLQYQKILKEILKKDISSISDENVETFITNLRKINDLSKENIETIRKSFGDNEIGSLIEDQADVIVNVLMREKFVKKHSYRNDSIKKHKENILFIKSLLATPEKFHPHNNTTYAESVYVRLTRALAHTNIKDITKDDVDRFIRFAKIIEKQSSPSRPPPS